jgi:hypothetical protein
MRAAILFALSMSLGCLQLTGVADYKVEETPPAPACTPPPGSTCDLVPNCGCTGNETCELASLDGAGVCTAAGDIPRNGVCTAAAPCGKGLTCVGNVCVPYCTTDADCDTNQCEPFNAGDPPTIVPNLGVCFKPCDPANDTCGEGLSCQQSSASRFSCVAAG